MGVDVQVEQAQSVFARGEIRGVALLHVLVDMFGAENVAHHVQIGVEWRAVGVSEIAFPRFVSAEQFPILFGDQVVRPVP